MHRTSLIGLMLSLFLWGGCPSRPATTDPTGQPSGDAWGGVPLLERKLLFGNPDKASPQLSPDGKQLAFLAPVDGVLNVWVGPVDDPGAAKPVTQDKGRGIRSYFWAYTSEDLLYIQDQNGDENWRVYRVNLPTGEVLDLTPVEGVAARVQEVSPKFPEEILVGLNEKNPQLHDLYRVNLKTGERKLLLENKGYLGFVTDDDYRIKLAISLTPDGGQAIFEADGKGGFGEFLTIPSDDTLTTSPLGFDLEGKTLYMLDSRNRDTGALVAVDMKTKEAKVLASDERADAQGVMIHPTEKRVQAVSFNYDRNRWEVLDESIQADFAALGKVSKGVFSVQSRSLDDTRWVVSYLEDAGPVKYYLWDREKQEAKLLFTNRTALEGKTLSPMHPQVIPARDGLSLVSYLTLPPWTDKDQNARPESPLPMVLLVHGGPWSRDTWGYNPYHQLLANRGYAVLSVNFRGSTGFGKKFINAANKQWGKKMHDDLLDAVDWAIKEGIAQKDKVAIMGGSYGGYATLVGLTMTPDVFACGVDIVGPSRITTLLSTIPPYWQPMIDLFKTRVGDWTTPEGAAALDEVSPLMHVDNIKKPLLIGQGANDPRVKQAESDQIVKAMQEKNIPVIYALFPDEGHGFARPENNLAFVALAETFLSQHLGGRAEPIGNAFEGSSITLPVGREDVPGLPDQVSSH